MSKTGDPKATFFNAEEFFREFYQPVQSEQPVLRVLVLEDDSDTMPLVRRMLKKTFQHCQVAWCSNIAEAVDLIEEQRFSENGGFDLILSDLRVPDHATGLEFWRYCTMASPLTPFAFMSAVSYQSFAEILGSDSQHVTFLQKQFDLSCRSHPLEQLLA